MMQLIPRAVEGYSDFTNLAPSTRTLLTNMTMTKFASNFNVPEVTPTILNNMIALASTTEAGNPGSSASPINGVPCRGSNGMIYLVDPASFDTVNLLVTSGNNIRPFDLTDEPIFIGLLLATKIGIDSQGNPLGGSLGFEWYPFGHRDSQPLILVPLPGPTPGSPIIPSPQVPTINPAPKPQTGGPTPGTVDPIVPSPQVPTVNPAPKPQTGGPTPGTNDGIVYDPSTPVTPPLPPVPGVRTINLRNFITLSSYTIDRQYIKDSLRGIPKEVVRVTNTSDEVEITVSLLGIAGVSFSPSTFDLPKRSSIDVDVLFDISVINQYPEGISAVNCVANLNSRTAVIDPFPEPPVVPVLPPQPPPVVIVDPPWQPPPVTPPTQPPVVPPNTGGPNLTPIDPGTNPWVPIPQTPLTPIDPGTLPWTPIPQAPLPPWQSGPDPVQPPAIPPVVMYWVDGTGSDNYILHVGLPPAGWVQDPYGGEWYPPNDPFVLRNFDRPLGTPLPAPAAPSPAPTVPPTHVPTPKSAPPSPQQLPIPQIPTGGSNDPFTIDNSIQFLI